MLFRSDAGRLRPHVKTHKMPEVIRLCLAQGIDRFKASTIAEVEMTAGAGGRDILLAYPVVGPAAARLVALAKQYPAVTFRAAVDSDRGIDDLERAAAPAGVKADALLDLNVGMNRTGVAPGPEAIRLARRIAASPSLSFGGLHVYGIGRAHV